MKIEIYDPAMCCSTGVCGPSIDPELVRIQDALRQIQKQAPAVAELLKNEGPQCLPLVFVDGVVLSKGRYPANEQLKTTLKQTGLDVTLAEKEKSSSCCGGPTCC